MPDGTKPEPGGWNRFSIEVGDLATTVEALRKAGAHFRNNIVTGIGGKQILLEDPSGNRSPKLTHLSRRLNGVWFLLRRGRFHQCHMALARAVPSTGV